MGKVILIPNSHTQIYVFTNKCVWIWPLIPATIRPQKTTSFTSVDFQLFFWLNSWWPYQLMNANSQTFESILAQRQHHPKQDKKKYKERHKNCLTLTLTRGNEGEKMWNKKKKPRVRRAKKQQQQQQNLTYPTESQNQTTSPPTNQPTVIKWWC